MGIVTGQNRSLAEHWQRASMEKETGKVLRSFPGGREHYFPHQQHEGLC